MGLLQPYSGEGDKPPLPDDSTADVPIFALDTVQAMAVCLFQFKIGLQCQILRNVGLCAHLMLRAHHKMHEVYEHMHTRKKNKNQICEQCGQNKKK